MCNRRKLSLSVFLACVLSLGLLPLAVAQNQLSSGEEKRTESQAEVQEAQDQLELRKAELQAQRASLEAQRQANQDTRCLRVTERLQLNINRYNDQQEGQTRVYAQVSERTAEVLDRLGQAGLDITEARAALNAFDLQLTTMLRSMEQAAVQAQGALEHACGDSDGAFVDALGQTRTSIGEVRNQALALRSYYQRTLGPALRALAGQVSSVSEE